MSIKIRVMKIEDYDQVYQIWSGITGFGIRTLDDSREGVSRFLRRNPNTCVVAEADGEIRGSILCGHDGRRGCLYHVCVMKEYRQLGIGQQMVKSALQALREEGINKVSLLAFKTNEVGNRFWQSLGWVHRDDMNYYDLPLNEENITNFVEDRR